MALYDLYHIEDRMKEQDSKLKRIDWNDRYKRHDIVAIDALGMEYVAMTVKPGMLDDRVLTRLKEIDPTNGYNPFREIDKWQAKKDHDEEKKIEDMAFDMADTLYKPIIKDAFY